VKARRAIVLACGNSLRSDDGVGLRIAEELRNELGDSQAEISCSHQWTPELAEKISKVDVAVFVDASATLAPGQVQVRNIAPGSEKMGATTHSINPERLLALAQSLYSSVPERAYLLTIGGESFDPGEELSPLVCAAIPVATARIKSLLKDAGSA
jgi:hydrogenase maturation protease